MSPIQKKFGKHQFICFYTSKNVVFLAQDHKKTVFLKIVISISHLLTPCNFTGGQFNDNRNCTKIAILETILNVCK